MTALMDAPNVAVGEERAVRWTPVDGGLWVATDAAGHRGRVDTDDRNRFHAYSTIGRSLGTHPTLDSARLAVERQEAHSRRVPGQRLLTIVTAIAGTAAVAMATAALMVTRL